jgi:threonine/homoserine efflux transporter RhtA
MSYGIWQMNMIVLYLALFLALPYLPSIWVLRKAGRSSWGYLLFLIPIVNIIWLWVFAFGHWPNVVEGGGSRSA